MKNGDSSFPCPASAGLFCALIFFEKIYRLPIAHYETKRYRTLLVYVTGRFVRKTAPFLGVHLATRHVASKGKVAQPLASSGVRQNQHGITSRPLAPVVHLSSATS